MRSALLTVLALLLCSCANLRPAVDLPEHPGQLQYWYLEGKLAVRYNGESNSAYFNWDNRDQYYTIRIHGPLGQGGAVLERNRQGVTLNTDGTLQTARSAEELLAMNLGWSFPVSDMGWWIRGLPSPDSDVERQQQNDDGQLQILEQQGWHIEYPRYQQWEHLTLPYKVVASRQNLTITLLLKQWRR